jgi:pimeloyl-ACP methyl ester carboxylesterase
MQWTRAGLVATIAVLVGVAMVHGTSPPVASEEHSTTFGAPGRRVSGRLFSSARVTAHPHLVVVLHGDAPGHDPVYQYDFARSLAAERDDTIVLALLRPGYRDGLGGRSDGDRGLAVGDNYTEDAARQLIDAVTEAAARLHARDTVLIGHSGGAAMALIMLADRPDLASSALIASCPCDLGAWRRHMAVRDFNPLFLLPVRSVSPLSRIGQLSPKLDLRLIVGERDAVAPPWLSRRFLQAGQARGLRVRLALAPGAGHEILESPEMLAAAKDLH